MNENDLENTKAVDAIASASFTWGSFQYDDAAEQYADLCKQEAENGRDAVLVKYGIKVGPVVIFDEDVLKSLKDSLCVDAVDPEVVGDDTTEFRKICEHIKTVVELLNFLREQCWDLWGGVPYVARLIFPELNLGKICYKHEMGVICWLLKSYNFVVDDEPFKEWDT